MLLPFSPSLALKPSFPKWVTGNLYGIPAYGVTTRLLTQGEQQAAPIWVPNTVTATSLKIEVTTIGSTGSVIRLGIYNDNLGQPGTLLVDAGTVSGTTTGVKSATISQVLTPGLYWLSGCQQGAPVTTTTTRSVNGGLALMEGPRVSGETYLRGCYSNYGITGAFATYATFALDSGDFMNVVLGI